MTHLLPNHWVNVQTPEDIVFLQEDLAECKRVAVDTETTGLTVKDQVFGLVLGVGNKDEDKKLHRVYWCNFNTADAAIQQAMVEILRTLFTSGNWNLLFHNAAFDLRMVHSTFDIPLRHENINDTMLLALVLCKWPQVGLKYLTSLLLDRPPVWAKEVAALKIKMGFKEDDNFPYTIIPENIIFPYACEDAENTFELFNAIVQHYRTEPAKLQDIYKLERRVARVTGRMEYRGMCIDLQYFTDLQQRLNLELTSEAAYYATRWGTYKNSKQEIVPTIHSHAKLADIVFQHAYPDGLHKDVALAPLTEKGAISVNMKELSAQFPDDPDIQRLVAYSTKRHTLDNFVDPILSTYVEWDDEDGQHVPPTVHTQFWQIKSTGRFSSARINLQNMANDKLASGDTLDDSLRRGFIAPPGYLYLTIDYKAFEVVALANASQDPVLVEHCLNGIDFHSVVGSMAYNRPYQELRDHVDALAKKQRTAIKRTSFAFLYGAGVKTIARSNGLTMDEAAKIKNALRSAYPVMMNWWDETYRQAGHYGYIYTLCGRLRRIDHSKAYTTSVNTVCQGTCADVLKYALADLEVLLTDRKSRTVHHVHDEIHFYVHPDDVEYVPKIVEIMQRQRFDPPLVNETTLGTYVPMLAELSTGPNWSDMKECSVEDIQTQLEAMK